MKKLYQRRLVFVTGKGGTGKSTCATAMALHAASLGQKVLLCEVDAYCAVGPILGVGRIGHEPVMVKPRLSICNVDRERSLVSIIKQFVPSDRIARALVQNKVTRLFLKAAPSANEISIMYRIAELTDSGRWETVFVDMPATGHALTFLDVPRSLSRLLKVGALAEMAHKLGIKLRDPAYAGLVIVTLPEEMPVNETIELHQAAAQKLGMPAALIMMNMIHKTGLNSDLEAIFSQLPDSDLKKEQQKYLSWAQSDQVYLDKLKSVIPNVPCIEIPLHYAESELGLAEKVAQTIREASSNEQN